MELISVILFVFQLKNFGNICKLSQFSKNDLKVKASLVSKLFISGQVNKFLQFLNIHSKSIIFSFITNFISKYLFSLLLFM